MLNYGRCTTANPQTRVGQVSGWQGRTAKVCVAADPACYCMRDVRSDDRTGMISCPRLHPAHDAG
eukprot:1157301-Pelagomonas_calceolata.AAC.5